MARVPVASDAFTADIGAAWDVGPGDFTGMVWSSSGVIQPTDIATDGAIGRNTGTYSSDQYCKISGINLNSATANFAIAMVRWQGGTDESCYLAHVGTDTGYYRYAIFRVNSSFGFTLIANSAGNGGAVNANSTMVLEAEGTTIRLYTDEGSGETLRLSVTDATLSGGRPMIGAFAASTGSSAQIGPWEGGNITGGGGGTNRRRRFLMAA